MRGFNLEDVDAQEAGMNPRKLDDLLIEAAKTSKSVEQIKKTAMPLWGLVVLCITIGAGGFKFYGDWQQTQYTGSPAMEKIKTELLNEIKDVRSMSTAKNDAVVQILSGQATTNALLIQRIDQAEKRLERLESKR